LVVERAAALVQALPAPVQAQALELAPRVLEPPAQVPLRARLALVRPVRPLVVWALLPV
jgi:hypothetical protein